jgi:hypothetical protein
MAPSNARGRGTRLARVAPATVARGTTFGGPRAEATAVVGSPASFQWWVTLRLSQRRRRKGPGTAARQPWWAQWGEVAPAPAKAGQTYPTALRLKPPVMAGGPAPQLGYG